MTWGVRLAAQADADFYDILAYTTETFGQAQAETYEAALKAAIHALLQGPNVPGSVARDDLADGLRTLHVARAKRRGRHVIVYRQQGPGVIEVVRILHEAMDFGRHLTT